MGGDLSGLMGKTPILIKMFARQLVPEIQAFYEAMQLEVWDGGIRRGAINLVPCWTVEILPIYVLSHKYTVSLFTVVGSIFDVH